MAREEETVAEGMEVAKAEAAMGAGKAAGMAGVAREVARAAVVRVAGATEAEKEAEEMVVVARVPHTRGPLTPASSRT